MILTGCELQGIPEVSELEKGMDFRKIEYRKEVFMRFYKFQMGFLRGTYCVIFSFVSVFYFYFCLFFSVFLGDGDKLCDELKY